MDIFETIRKKLEDIVSLETYGAIYGGHKHSDP